MENTTIDFLSPWTTQFGLALLAAVVLAYISVRVASGRSHKLANRWPIVLMRGLLLLAVLSLLLNPVRVQEQAGSIEPSQVFFMLDASESMAIGNNSATRWDQAVDLIQSAAVDAHETAAAEVSLFRFGRRLRAVESPAELGFGNSITDDGHGVSFVEKLESSNENDSQLSETLPLSADEPDTQLFVALRQISSRFGRKPPSAVVVFSDGRARDASRAKQVATAFRGLRVPVHTVPIGSTASAGDVALVSLVVPSTARKQSEVQATAFLRSYGFDGAQAEVTLNAIDDAGRRVRRLATVPVTLESGFQSVPVAFHTDTDTKLLEASVTEQANEVSTDNNAFNAEMMISREKIRVLYVEGSPMRAIPTVVNGIMQTLGPTSSLREALQEDLDIECVPVQVSVTQMRGSGGQLGSFPRSVAELSAFDAIILSDVPRRTFSPKQLEWIEVWVRRRGGGLCMVGGRNSFASGQWRDSLIAKMLPVEFADDYDWRGDLKIVMTPDDSESVHPLFRLADDLEVNRQLIDAFPGFHGANVGLFPRANLAQVLAVTRPSGFAPEQTQSTPPSSLFSASGIRNFLTRAAEPDPQPPPDGVLPSEFAGITVGQYGRGRTMAMAVPITGNPADKFLKWGRGEGHNQYFGKFWRNAVYWLTEQSFIGRRRLIASADKRYYSPGESITLTGAAFDEGANETSGYRLVGMVEPQSFDNIESDYSIVRWPNNVPREEETESPFIIWGEEFEIPVEKRGDREFYQIALQVAETLPSGMSNQSLRIELTAYEDYTQVDSTSVPIQILHDPFEQQNPFPNHELLTTLAEESGGAVLHDKEELADMLSSLPVVRGPSEQRRSPLWSSWPVLGALLCLISAEWCYRRWIGLA